MATYDYVDAGGRVLYRVARHEPKGFLPQHLSEAGVWEPGYATNERIVYRLPDLLADPGRSVFLVEGEKDADRLAALGFIATTNAGGSSSWRKHAAEYAEVFRGRRRAIIVPDHDAPGQGWATEVALSLHDVGCSVRVLKLPDLPDGGDVSDWLDAGHTVEDLKRLAAAAPTWPETSDPTPQPPPEMVSAAAPEGPAERIRRAWRTAADVAVSAPEQVDWVIRPYVVAGGITELAGPPKSAGKTTLILHMVARVAGGGTFLGGSVRRGPAVMLTEERDATLRRGLARAGLLDCPDLHILRRSDAAGAPWQTVCLAAAARCREVGAVLLIVDTASEWMQLHGDDENSSGAVMAAMEPLQALAASGVAVLLARHERKGGGIVGESARGSNAFAGAVDVVLVLRRPDGNTSPNLRQLSALSRFDETPSNLIIELTEAGYVALGDQADVERQRAEAAIADVLPSTAASALTVEEVMKLAETRRTMTQDVLAHIGAATTGTGKKGSPRRFYRAATETDDAPSPPSEMVSAGTPSLRAAGSAAESDDHRRDHATSVQETPKWFPPEPHAYREAVRNETNPATSDPEAVAVARYRELADLNTRILHG